MGALSWLGQALTRRHHIAEDTDRHIKTAQEAMESTLEHLRREVDQIRADCERRISVIQDEYRDLAVALEHCDRERVRLSLLVGDLRLRLGLRDEPEHEM